MQALVLLLAYACAMPSVLPTAFAMLARMEGSHGIEMSAGAEETDVVLTHPGAEGKSHDAIHHHCLFAKALAAFAEAPRDHDPDHRVKFACSAARLLEKRTIVPVISLSADAFAPEYFVIAEITIPQPDGARDWLEVAPPRPPDALLELKSTLLLI